MKTKLEQDLFALYSKILNTGEKRVDRTGVGTLSIFGERLVIDLDDETIPIITSKFVPFKSVLTELLWFIEGSSDERRLCELVHGTRDSEKNTIWTPNAKAPAKSFKPEFDGDLGQIYGKQWRSWNYYLTLGTENGNVIVNHKLDQLQTAIDLIKNDPTNRRILVSAWNPGEISQMALPPCHILFQFYVSNDGFLSCQMYQRSVDSFLGLPFNITSYALLVKMIAKTCDLLPGKLTMCLGDTHIYLNHTDQVKTQLTRSSFELPKLKFDKKNNINDYKLEDFELVDYKYHPKLVGVMAA